MAGGEAGHGQLVAVVAVVDVAVGQRHGAEAQAAVQQAWGERGGGRKGEGRARGSGKVCGVGVRASAATCPALGNKHGKRQRVVVIVLAANDAKTQVTQ